MKKRGHGNGTKTVKPAARLLTWGEGGVRNYLHFSWRKVGAYELTGEQGKN